MHNDHRLITIIPQNRSYRKKIADGSHTGTDGISSAKCMGIPEPEETPFHSKEAKPKLDPKKKKNPHLRRTPKTHILRLSEYPLILKRCRKIELLALISGASSPLNAKTGIP
jgi:hypothetical protein